MGRVDGKVAFITGAARGQGRAHAVRLADEGADIIAVDLCGHIDTVAYPMAEPEDLTETVKQVEALDRRIVAREADVRDLEQLEAAATEGLTQLGHIDILCANAGIASMSPTLELSEQMWQDMLDVNLTGVWKTVKAVVPSMIEAGRGGSVILTSSVAGLVAMANIGHYVAAKHGVTGLMRTLAIELAQHSIRVNSVHPTTVDTPMVQNPTSYELFMPGSENPTRDDAASQLKALNALAVPWVEVIDISNAVLWLASDESRYVTGTTVPVDAGSMAPFKIPHG